MVKLKIVKFVSSKRATKPNYAVNIEIDDECITSISVTDERMVGFLVALAGAGNVKVEESKQTL